MLFREGWHLVRFAERDHVRDVAVADLQIVQIRSFVAGRIRAVAVRAAIEEQLPAVSDERG